MPSLDTELEKEVFLRAPLVGKVLENREFSRKDLEESWKLLRKKIFEAGCVSCECARKDLAENNKVEEYEFSMALTFEKHFFKKNKNPYFLQSSLRCEDIMLFGR